MNFSSRYCQVLKGPSYSHYIAWLWYFFLPSDLARCEKGLTKCYSLVGLFFLMFFLSDFKPCSKAFLPNAAVMMPLFTLDALQEAVRQKGHTHFSTVHKRP